MPQNQYFFKKMDILQSVLFSFTWLRIVLPMKKEATWSGSTFWRRSLLTFSMVSISSLSVLKQRSNRKSTRQPSSSWEKQEEHNMFYINQKNYLHMRNKTDVHTLLFEAYCRSSDNTNIPVWPVWGTRCKRWRARPRTWSEGPSALPACRCMHI